MLRQPDCRKPCRPDPRTDGASRHAWSVPKAAHCEAASRGPPAASGTSHLLMAPRAGQLRIMQRIPGDHAWPWIPSPAREQSSARRRRRDIRHLTADGTSGFSAQNVVRGTGEDGRSAAGGKRLTATAVPGVKDLRWWPEASPLLTPGPFPCHVAFVVDRLLLRSTPVGGTLGKNSGKFDFSFLLRARHFPSRKRGP